MIYVGQSVDNGIDPLRVGGTKVLDPIPALLHLVEKLHHGAVIYDHSFNRVELRQRDLQTLVRTTYSADGADHPFFAFVARLRATLPRDWTWHQHINRTLGTVLNIDLNSYDQYLNHQSLRPADLIAAWQLAEQGEGHLAELLELAIS